jgi:PAS domain S-box-containing protein
MKNNVKVLLVDDDKATRSLIKLMLKDLDYTVVGVAKSGAEAIQKAKKLLVDVVLMDVIMESQYAGIDAALSIRKELDIPVILLTVSSEEETMVKALESDLFGYLVKPVKPETLRASIEVSLLRYRYEKKLHKYQKALQESETLFRGIFSTMQNGFYRISKDNTILLANPAMAKMLGYESEKQLIGKNIYDLGFVDVESRNRFNEVISKNGKVTLLESNWITREGSVINIIESARIVRDDQGEVLYYEGSINDITKLKTLEAQLRHSQKMELIGTLASRVAHGINNHLTSILGYSDLCLMKIPKDDKLHKYVKAIRNNARNATGVVRQLLHFSRKQPSQPRIFNLNSLIASMREMIIQILGKNIHLTVDLSDTESHISADPRLIEQVIMNLIINARDAMPEGGELRFQTRREIIDETSRWKSEIPHGSYIVMEIADTGVGMSPEVRKRIFDPFFTTKDEKIGTGLGLSIVWEIIKDSNGYISVESVEGKGTDFHIFFPIVEKYTRASHE